MNAYWFAIPFIVLAVAHLIAVCMRFDATEGEASCERRSGHWPSGPR